jgi:hypothetical protein
MEGVEDQSHMRSVMPVSVSFSLLMYTPASCSEKSSASSVLNSEQLTIIKSTLNCSCFKNTLKSLQEPLLFVFMT